MSSLDSPHANLAMGSPDLTATGPTSLSFDPLSLWMRLGRHDLVLSVLSNLTIEDIKSASQVSDEWNKIIADTLGHFITLLVRNDSVARTAAEVRGMSLTEPSTSGGASLVSRARTERVETDKIIDMYRVVASNTYKAVKNRPVNSDILESCDPIIRISIPQPVTRCVIDAANNTLATFGSMGAQIWKLEPTMSNLPLLYIGCTRPWYFMQPRKFIMAAAILDGSLAVVSFSLDCMTWLTLYSVEDGTVQQQTVIQEAGIVRPRKADISMTSNSILVMIVFRTTPSYHPLRKVLVFSRSLMDAPTEHDFYGDVTLSLHHDRVLLHYEKALLETEATVDADDEDDYEEEDEMTDTPSLDIYQVDCDRKLSLIYTAPLKNLIMDQMGIEESSYHDRFCSATIIGDRVMTVVKGYGGWEDTPSCLLVHDLATKQVLNTHIEAWHLSSTSLTSLGVLVETNPPRLVTWSDLLTGARDNKATPDAYGVLGTGDDVKVFEDGFVVLDEVQGFVHFYKN